MNKEHYHQEQLKRFNEAIAPKEPKPIYPAQGISNRSQEQRFQTFLKLKEKYGIPIKKGN